MSKGATIAVQLAKNFDMNTKKRCCWQSLCSIPVELIGHKCSKFAVLNTSRILLSNCIFSSMSVTQYCSFGIEKHSLTSVKFDVDSMKTGSIYY